jgi:hypothetical protein
MRGAKCRHQHHGTAPALDGLTPPVEDYFAQSACIIDPTSTTAHTNALQDEIRAAAT